MVDVRRNDGNQGERVVTSRIADRVSKGKGGKGERRLSVGGTGS